MQSRSFLADSCVDLAISLDEETPPPARIPVELADTYGTWQRLWMQSQATQDDSTLVLWMQANELHVDMRLPARVMALESAASLSVLDSAQLRLLASAEGFAGKTRIKNSVGTWRRRINLQGPMKCLDMGVLRQTPNGLLESGLHREYNQLWQHRDREKPQERMLSDCHGRTIIILWTKTRFAMGRGWPGRTAHNRTLPEHVDYALGRQDQAALARAFDQEFCFGRIEDDHGIVEHSTQPMRRGTLAFDARALLSHAECIEFSLVDFFGQVSLAGFRPTHRRLSVA